jgi:hypothetical protein
MDESEKRSAIGRKSRRKGKTGEREWVLWLRERGVSAKRTQQFRGGVGSADVDVPAVPDLHSEVKRRQRIDVEGSVEQAKADGGPDSLPIVAHRRDHGRWLVSMDAEDWLRLFLRAFPHALSQDANSALV